jgi:hypothetical protein
MEKVYRTNWVLFTGVLIGVYILLLLRAWPIPSWEAFFDGTIYYFVFIGVMFFLVARFTYVIITPDKRMKNVNITMWHIYRNFFIQDITKIERAPLFRGLGWAFGYQLFVYFKPDNAPLDATQINLNVYKKETITDLLRTLLEINPNIKLDEEVEKMLEQGSGKKAKS